MFDDVDVLSALAEPTVMRSEASEQADAPLDDFSQLEFSPIPEPETVPEPAEETAEPYTEKEAKENAEMLVDLLDTFNTTALTPLARWKLRKKRGGKTAIQRMQQIAAKEFAGEKLTAPEKRILFQYNAYLADKKELESSIPFTPDEKERLIHSATIWLKNKRIRIGGEFGFWGEYAMIQGTRVMEILTA